MKKNKKETFWAYLCSAPSLLLILLIVVFPILYTAYISFTNMNVYHWFNFSFVGLKNYKDALFVFDSGFLAALLRTILWTVLNMVLQLVIAFVLASLLNIQDFKGRRVYKTLLMIPWAMPGYVSILLWKNGIFNSQFGLLNQAGAGDSALAGKRCLGISLLHGCQPLAGAAVYDYDYGWCIAGGGS